MKTRTAVLKSNGITPPVRNSSADPKNEQKPSSHSNFVEKKDKPKAKPRSTRKRKRRRSSTSSSSSCDNNIDPKIEEKLQQCAQKNNLTHDNVKNIIQKVVRNDHVLAIVKLKEEEMEKHEQARKLLKMSQLDDDDDADTMKLTRAKARALNKIPLPLVGFHPQPDSEVVALIHDELHSDDEDEEYQPGEDDMDSDDDLNTTTSDVDSQPRTPQTPHTHADDEDLEKTVYTKDGLFKIPRARTDSAQSEQEYIIAQRTRSKISLTETPIEAIESTFRAPDIPTDFYDNTECDVDNDTDWIQFLNNFTMPLNQEIEKDEDADPDYVAADRDLVDKEELRNINVPKKELEDLFNELYESLVDVDLDEGSFLTPAPISALSNSVTSPPALNTPTKHTHSLTTTSCKLNSNPKTPSNKTKAAAETATCFSPSVMSTPAVAGNLNKTAEPTRMDTSTTAETSTAQSSVSANADTTVAVTAMDLSNTFSYPINPITFSPMKTDNSIMIPFITLNPFQNTTTTATALLPHNFVSPIIISMPPQNNTETIITTTPPAPTFITNTNKQTEIKPADACSLNETEIVQRPGCRSKHGRFKNANFQELEHLDPNLINTEPYAPHHTGFTNSQIEILEKQLRMHVQLSTQSFLQTFANPEHHRRAADCKQFLTDLNDIVEEPGKEHRINVWNLRLALDLLENCESQLNNPSKENNEFVQFQQTEIDKVNRNTSYIMSFHERYFSTVCNSKVFMYPNLLPKRPFRPEKHKKIAEYLPAEDYLIAFNLERYYTELREKNRNLKSKTVSLLNVCKHISANILYLRNAKSILDYIRMKRNSPQINPIKYYFQHGKAPPYWHNMEVFDGNYVIEPRRRAPAELPYQFANYVEKLNNRENEKLTEKYATGKRKTTTDYSTQQPPIQIVTPTVRSVPNLSASYSQNQTILGSPIKIRLIYDNDEIILKQDDSIISAIERINDNRSVSSDRCTCSHRCFDETTVVNEQNVVEKGQTLLTSYYPIVPKVATDKKDTEKRQKFRKKKVAKKRTSVNKRKYRFQFIDIHKRGFCYRNRKILQKYLKKSSRKQIVRNQSIRKLSVIRKKFLRVYTKSWQKFKNKINLLLVFICIQIFEQYTSALLRLYGLHRLKKSGAESESNRKHSLNFIIANRRVHQIFRGQYNKEAIKMPSSSYLPSVINTTTSINATPSTGNDLMTKRLPKGSKTVDNVKLMLLPDSKQEALEKDFLFAQHYVDKVEEVYLSENNHQKITEFLNILRSFDESRDRTTDLYRKIEKLFNTDHPELADFFLNFLSPSDAVQIGKFMEHFMYTNQSTFINKLNVFFHKQPAQIRKVLTCLKDLSDDDCLKLDKIRNKVLPLLKGNQLLIDWFLECIGNEPIPDGLSHEYETVSFRKGAEMGIEDSDMYESIPQSEIFADPLENPCNIRYINGKIYYGNRILLHGKLSFSLSNGDAPPTPLMSDKNGNDALNAPKENDSTNCELIDNKNYHCVHDIKHYGDMKIREQSRNPIESDQILDTVISEENDDSDDGSSDEIRCDMDIERDNDIGFYTETTTTISATVPPIVQTTGNIANASTVPTVQPTPPISNEFLCDEILLKAHGIRLSGTANPTICQNSNEMLNMLKPLLKTERSNEADKEERLSPKKSVTAKCFMTTQSKLQRKSPKKSNFNLIKSPNAKKLLSPSAQQTVAPTQIPTESPVLLTAKKLKRYLESDDDQNSDEKNTADEIESNASNDDPAVPRKTSVISVKIRKLTPAPHLKPSKVQPQKNTSTQDTSKNDTVPDNLTAKSPQAENETTSPRKAIAQTDEKFSSPKQEDTSTKPLATDKSETVANITNTTKPEIIVIWSREEDRILLEQIKNGLAVNSGAMENLSEQLSDKSVDEIKERVNFLIDFLTKLKNKT